MLYRRVTKSDYPGILALQEANLFENLSEAARREGFLSARFTAGQFEKMNRDAAIVVAEEAGRIAAYACSAGMEDSLRTPILAAMIHTFTRTAYLGTPLADARTCIYGPVCVDSAKRGKGVFRSLIAALKVELAGRYEVAAAFIAKSNAHSLAAHVDGVGMTVEGEFGFNHKTYWIVCFGIPAAELACGVGPRD
ncbi:MAG: N-acetyltransferase family protein [Burkholderiales bacterium]